MRLRFVLVVLCSLLAAGCAAPRDEGPDGSWSFTDTRGTTWSSESLERPALVFFAATWCEPCREAAPELARLHEAYGERVQFLTVGWDTTQSAAHLDAWAREHGHDWPHGTDLGRPVARALGVDEPGSVAVVAADGSPAWMGPAGVGYEDLSGAIESALRE